MKRTTKRVIIFVITFDLILIIVTVLFHNSVSTVPQANTSWIGSNVLQEQGKQLDDGVIDFGNELSDEALQVGEALSYITIGGVGTVVEDNLDFTLSNAEESRYAVSMMLYDAESGKLIASTDLIDPGYSVSSLPLAEKLSPGKYPCLARLSFYLMKNDAYIGDGARQVLVYSR